MKGRLLPGFEPVEREFEKNFTQRGELGAACAIYHKGTCVVDVWAGCRDEKTEAPWEEDTLTQVFSMTKGMAALAIAVAHSRGLLDYDERIAAYWPEFAQQGKEAVTLRQLLDHRAGLCAVDQPLDLETLSNHNDLDSILARQKPAWIPGTKHGYHMWTQGWYLSALLRRVDPQHRSLGQFFQDEVAQPLGLEFYMGLPPSVREERVATLKPVNRLTVLLNLDKVPYLRSVLNPLNSNSITYRTVMNPRILTNHRNYNACELRALEAPSANGIGQARSMAKAYSVFATGGAELGIQDDTLEALIAPVAEPQEGWRDEILLVDTSYSLGFVKPFHAFQFGASDTAFGCAGAGVGFAFADPDAQVGYAYASNKMTFYGQDDPREKAVRDAFYQCLARQGHAAGMDPDRRDARDEDVAEGGGGRGDLPHPPPRACRTTDPRPSRERSIFFDRIPPATEGSC
ncbi:MAG TPA: class A beta-lactamase-related serine hydrolase [Chloroflexi bacterium]|nr:class A beta-lactamase-related serine hydrolase [Chloroflexota bacterium]